MDSRRADPPGDRGHLRALAAEPLEPEDAVAVNAAIVERAPSDTAALNRLGRAYETLKASDRAEETFRRCLAVDPRNAIATRRLRDLAGRSQRR